jgi:crotonobetainyl-CoA:carnitine CoA-transferase CaiB-like acyl-CoA transferase
VGGILASLIARGRTGLGQRVDIPMFETMVGFVLGDHLGGLTYEPPLDGGGYARQLSPYRRPYRTKDSYICALVYNDKQWEGFLRAIGRESLQREDARFATFANRSRNIDFVYEWLSDIFGEHTTAEWMRVLEEADIPMMPMHDFESVLEDPHLTATRFFTTVEHPTEGTIRSMRAPVSFFGTPIGSWIGEGAIVPQIPGGEAGSLVRESLAAHRAGRSDERLFLWCQHVLAAWRSGRVAHFPS